MTAGPYRKLLDDLYRRYNRRRYVHPDPLEFLYDYPDLRDRQIAGLVAATLAVGRVASILRSVSAVLGCLGPRPAEFLDAVKPARLRRLLAGFRHRFFSGDDVAALLLAARNVVRSYGSLEGCFAAGLDGCEETVLPALGRFVDELLLAGCCRARSNLLPHPRRGSACKRLNLYLRWMVRRDAVDPGGWRAVTPDRLIVPLDTHMYKIALALGLTRRKQPDLGAALDVTAAFRSIAPADPVRYDFALTRLGIRSDAEAGEFIRHCAGVACD